MMKKIFVFVFICILAFNMTVMGAGNIDLRIDNVYAVSSGYSVFDIKYTFDGKNGAKYVYFYLTDENGELGASTHHYWLKFNHETGDLGYMKGGVKSASQEQKIFEFDIGREYNITAVYSYNNGSDGSEFMIYINGEQCGGIYSHASAEYANRNFHRAEYNISVEDDELLHEYKSDEINTFSSAEYSAKINSSNPNVIPQFNYDNYLDHSVTLKGSYSAKKLKNEFARLGITAKRGEAVLAETEILQTDDVISVTSPNGKITNNYTVTAEAGGVSEPIVFINDGTSVSAASDVQEAGYALYLAQYVDNELMDLSIDTDYADGFKASVIPKNNGIIKAFLWDSKLSPICVKVFGERLAES